MAETEQVQVTFTDDDSAAAIAQKLVDSLDTAFARSVNRLGDRLEKPLIDMAKGAAKAGKTTSQVFDDIDRTVRNAARSLDGFSRTMNGIRNTTARTGSMLDPDVFDASSRSFGRLEENIERITRNFGELSRTAGGRQVLGDLTAAVRSQANQANVAQQSVTAVAVREAAARADAARVAQQRITALEVRASKERVVAAQQEGAQTLATMRATSRQRIAIIQSLSRQLQTLQQSMTRIAVAGARAFNTGLSGLGNVFTTIASRARTGTQAINRELNSTNTILDRRTSVFRSAFRSQESILRSSVNNQVTQIERLDRALSTGVLGAASGRSAAAGALGFGGILAGGAGLTTLLTSGFTRFSEIERLNKQFLALTGNAADSALLMAQIKEFAKTTSFDLVGVADLAKGFLAMGTATQDVLPRVRTIADAVALTGGGVDELNRIQRAIGQVVSAGRLQGDELNQLAENLPGLNIRQILAQQLGKSVPELIEMQEAGEITADMFLTGLLTGLSEDQRLSGAAQDLAETVKGRFDNLKESFADLGAALIGEISGGLRVAFKVLNDAFAGLAQFIRGDNLSGALQALRTGLQGAAAALALFVAGLAALQSLRTLGVILGAIVSPLGLIVAAVAGAGAAFKLLTDNSPAFREALSRAGEILSNVGPALGELGDAFGRLFGTLTDAGTRLLSGVGEVLGGVLLSGVRTLTDFLVDDAIPAITRFVDFVAENLLSGVAAVGEFVSRNVLPPLRDFAGVIMDDVVPAVQRGASRAFELLGEAVSNFWDIAQPILQPAADGIMAVAAALRTLIETNPQTFFATLGAGLAGALGGFAVAGPVGALIGGVGAATGALFAQGFGDEIISGLRSVGDMVVGALQSGLDTAGAALRRVFTIDNIIDFGLFATELAQRLGRVIGNALSDPRLVAGVAGVAGFAALAAGRFILGFGQGVLSNVPELADMIGSALEAALRAAVSSLLNLDTGTLALGLAAAFIGTSALRAFRSAGVTAGTEVKTGMLQSFRTGAFGGAFAGGGSAAGAGRSFFTGLLGGPDALANTIRTQVARANSVALAETKRLNATLALAGRGVSPQAGGIGATVRSEYAKLVSEVGPSGILGLRLRAGVQAGINSLRNLSATPFRQFLNDMGTSGFQLAKQVGAKVAAGIAGGIAGFQVGQSLAGAGILQQVLGVGGVALGVGAINPVAGAAAGALGVLGVAMGEVGRAADESKAKIAQYADALSGIAEADIADAGLTVFLSTLKGEGDEVVDLLADLDFNARKFIEGVSSGRTDGLSTFKELLTGLGTAGTDLADFMSKEGIDSVREFEEALRGTGEGVRLRKNLEDIGVDAVTLADAFGLLIDESGAVNAALDRAADTNAVTGFNAISTAAGELSPKLASAVDQLQLFGTISTVGTQLATAATTQAADDARLAYDNARLAAEAFLNGDYGNSLQGALDELILTTPSIDSTLAGLAELPAQVAEATRRQLGDSIQVDLRAIVATGLETGEITNPGEYLAQLRGAIQSHIDSGSITATAGAAIIGQIDSLTADPNFNADMASLLQSIVDNGTPPVVPAPFTLDPQVTIPDDTKARIGNDIAAALGSLNSGGGGQFGMSRGMGGGGQTLDVGLSLNPQITLAPGATVAAAAAGVGLADAVAGGFASGSGRIATAATSAMSLAILSVLSTAGQAAAAGSAIASSFAAGLNAGRGAAVGAAAALGQAASSAVRTNAGAAFAAGVAVAQGLAAGIRSGAGGAIAAARAMANAVISIVRSALQIASPSKVFADIGRDIGLGLAQGIADEEDSLIDLVNGLVSRTVEAAKGVGGAAAAGASQIFANSLPATFGGGVSNVDLLRQELGLQNVAGQAFTLFESTRAAIAEAAAKIAKGEATSAFERELATNDFRSLSGDSRAGVENVSGFLDIGERIREFAETALLSGRDFNTVIAQVQAYRNELIRGAQVGGAYNDQIGFLIDQLGLGDQQLRDFAGAVQQMNNAIPTALPSAKSLEEAEERRREAEEAAADAIREAEEQRKDREDIAREKEESDRALMLELLRLAVSQPRTVQVTPPYGDPEAIGLTVLNKIASDLSVGS